ncbi:hypothetical protein [Natronorubrum sp. DTA7]|uniref:hypothetical protein n=1 Tax=Natronorubrum sp. DTA7 TaxID=3447016 RepID=UPI003F8710C4
MARYGGDPDGTRFLFRHELDHRAGTVRLELGTPMLVALASAGGLLWALVLEGTTALLVE